MGFFDFFKKKKTVVDEPKETENSLILGMLLFKNNGSYNAKAVINHLQEYWGLKVENDPEHDNDETIVVEVDGQTVALANMKVPFPDDLSSLYPFSFHWPNSEEELANHTSHSIVTLLSSSEPQVKRYQLFSKVVCSVMMTCEDCIGIYQGAQTLLLPTEFYLNCVDELKDGGTPVPVWVYLGIRTSDKGNSVFTYGMKEFGFNEMEVINSTEGLDTLYSFMLDMAYYVIGNDVEINHGETIGRTEDEKVEVTLSKAVYLEGNSLKMNVI